MTDELPDDVVERATNAFNPMWKALCTDVPSEFRDRLRAALRVAVEWEREQCARVADAEKSPYDDPEAQATAECIADNIRARSRKD